MNTFDYEKFLDYLKSKEDLEYKKFHLSLKGANEMIGVRTPILRNIAKDISKNDYQNFIKSNTKKYYEECAILAYLIGYLKVDFHEVLKILDENIDCFDSWALTDGLCSTLKIFKNNQEEGFEYIKKILKSNNPWHIRIGLVLMLNYYINDKYIDNVLELSRNIKNENYYVKMANAWLLSVAYIKYKNKVNNILEKVDDFTRRKTISKINDSRRVIGKIIF